MFTEGHIIVKRTIKEWGWYHDPKMFTLFAHMMIDANYTDTEWEGRTIKRGQLVTSIALLAADTGLSVQEVRTCLKKLGGSGEVRSTSIGRRSIITLCNYDSYQNNQQGINKEATSGQQGSNTESTSSQHAISKEGNNATKKEKKKSKYSAEVEELYAMYPSKCPMRNSETGRRPFCKDIIARLLKERSFDDLKANMQRYLDENYGKHYLQNFSTFLHQFPDYSEGQGVLFREKKWKVAGERYTKEDVNRLVTDQNEFLSIPPAIRMALHDGKEVMWDGERFTIAG